MDEYVFNEGLKRVAKCKADYLEAEYLVFLETKRPAIQFNPLKLERLRLGSKAAMRAYVEANQGIGRHFPSSLNNELHEYIKSKGHKPRRTFGLVFALALVTTFFACFLALMVFQRGTAGSLDALVLGTFTAALFWFWWSKKETF
jgi:hypothetical protein